LLIFDDLTIVVKNKRIDGIIIIKGFSITGTDKNNLSKK
jgi:hypothetical protein